MSESEKFAWCECPFTQRIFLRYVHGHATVYICHIGGPYYLRVRYDDDRLPVALMAIINNKIHLDFCEGDSTTGLENMRFEQALNDLVVGYFQRLVHPDAENYVLCDDIPQYTIEDLPGGIPPFLLKYR